MWIYFVAQVALQQELSQSRACAHSSLTLKMDVMKIGLVENATDKNDVLEAIERHPFLKSKFDRISEMYDLRMPYFEK